MKSISAAIIVASGAALVFGGMAFVRPESAPFVVFPGFVLGVAGLVGWFKLIWSAKDD
jgi:hypothetical protein